MAKGSDFAREISRDYSLYLTWGDTEDGVWLTEGSGARATKRSQLNKTVRTDQYGDITYTIPETKYFFDLFSVELKTGYAKKTKSKDKKRITLTHWSMMDLIDSSQNTPQFHEFWEQCLNDSIESKREPLLIFRRNRRYPCIAMHTDIFNGYVYKFGRFDGNIIEVKFGFTPYPIVALNLRQFFNWSMNFSQSWLKQMVCRKIMKRKEV